MTGNFSIKEIFLLVAMIVKLRRRISRLAFLKSFLGERNILVLLEMTLVKQ